MLQISAGVSCGRRCRGSFSGQQEEVSRRQERIDELMAEREKSLRDIKEQDQVIGEKEQKIYDLKKRNQELEKYRYVDHRSHARTEVVSAFIWLRFLTIGSRSLKRRLGLEAKKLPK